MNNLTPEQLKQIEKNKQIALEKLRSKQNERNLLKTPTKNKPVQRSINAYFTNPIPKTSNYINHTLKSNASDIKQGTAVNALQFGSDKKKLKTFDSNESKEPASLKHENLFKPTFFLDSKEENENSTPKKEVDTINSKMLPKNSTQFKQASTNNNKETRYEWLVDIRDKNGKRICDEGYDKRTLLIPSYAMNKFTSFEKQYWDIKKDNFDTVVFFKKGKFYELYEKDAYLGNELFDLKLTERINMSMVGVPESSFENWVSKFIGKGYKVAKVDQMDNQITKTIREKQNKDSTQKSSIIKRELTNIYTIGTLTDPNLINSEMCNYCLSIKETKNRNNKLQYGLAFVDAATAKFYLCSFEESGVDLSTFICQIMPKEILVEKGSINNSTIKQFENNINNVVVNYLLPNTEFLNYADSIIKIKSYFKKEETFPSVLNNFLSNELVISALGALITYLCNVKLDDLLVGLGNFEKYDFNNPMSSSQYLALDAQTLINLQVNNDTPNSFEHSTYYDENNQYVSIYALLNHCYTPFGKRLLKQWVNKPLANSFLIKERQAAIININNSQQLESILGRLANLPDMERLVSRVHYKQIKATEFMTLIDSLQEALLIVETIKSTSELTSSLLQSLVSLFPDIKNKIFYFKDAFDHQLAKQEGLMVPYPGIEKEYDEINNRIYKLESDFEDYLNQQRQALNCTEIQYKHIGKEIYQLEIPSRIKTNHSYNKLSQTKAFNRYWTSQLQSMVTNYQELKELRILRLKEIQSVILEKFDLHYTQWTLSINTLAVLDCLSSLAQYNSSLTEPKTLPLITDLDRPFIDITDSRHPCLTLNVGKDFIPNDIKLGKDVANVCLVTGPNMGGKSTILKQTCALVIIAQIGCLVPASKCVLTPFNAIMSRIGANDNILEGKSTFYVELFETNRILKLNKQIKALAIIDELGRGTSTMDGYSIAYACLHYLCHKMNNVISLFTTHYTKLINDFSILPKAITFKHMKFTINSNNSLLFLYKFVDGACPNSYGLNVAQMAKLDENVLSLASLKSQHIAQASTNNSSINTSSLDLNTLLLALGSLLIDQNESNNLLELSSCFKNSAFGSKDN